MRIQHFFDERTSTLSYVVDDPETRTGIVIDPVADFEPRSGRISTASCERIARYVEERSLRITHVFDTHAHADHLTGMPYFQDRFGTRSVIGARIVDVQEIFRDIYHLGSDFPADGSQFDVLMQDRQLLTCGSLDVEALHVPGHTPACMAYRIGGALFVGDTLFMPDYGTARCDFPGGSAEQLYESIQSLYALHGDHRVFTCHDYRPGGRPLRFESTIDEERRRNVQLDAGTSKEAFVAFRKQRDATLGVPELMLAAIQVNIRAGRLPPAESNGVSYLKIPLGAF